MNKDGQKGGEKECHSCDANKNTQKKKKKRIPQTQTKNGVENSDDCVDWFNQ